MNTAPEDGDIGDTVELFQTRYNKKNGYAVDDDEPLRRGQPQDTMVILPSGWRKRLSKPGSVYQYSKTEVMEYNEVVYLHGEAVAKRWADRRWHERTKRNA